MALKKNSTETARKEVYRFAHPFFTNVPPTERKAVPGVGTRMTDHIQTKLEKIPVPKGDSVMKLSEIIGQSGVADIEKAKSITFHSTGDTGHENGTWQELVADAMRRDYHVNNPQKSPAFFLHLGDVIYYANNDKGYHGQFYAPYTKYPGKIIAIPGNHDGELFKYDGTTSGQKKSLEAFQKNFCLPHPSVPPAAGTIYRQMVSQPGVYWMLDAPFVNIIGLYSNVAEGPGYLAAPGIGTRQVDWMVKTLKGIRKHRDNGKRKALVIAVHHPPFSNSSHSSSTAMLHDIDTACSKSEILPDAVLAAHAHDYQRYTRYVSVNGKSKEIPFTVAGSGGRGLSSHVPQAKGTRKDDHSFDKSLKGYGYQRITVTENDLTINFIQVTETSHSSFDKVVVDLKTNKLR